MKIQFSRCTRNNLDNVPIRDGQLVFVKDTNEQYIDTNSKRSKLTDLMFIPDRDTLNALQKPSDNKLYYVIADNSINFHCNNKWQTINTVNMENILTKDNEIPYTPTKDYHPATKKYVDDAVKDISEKLFVKSFTSDDWKLSGQDYILTITQAEHRLSSPCVLSLEMLDDNDLKSVCMYGSKLQPNGNLLVLSDLKYDGKIILKGGN